MTVRVTKRKRPETVDQKLKRLMKRIVRLLPVTAGETRFVLKHRTR